MSFLQDVVLFCGRAGEFWTEDLREAIEDEVGRFLLLEHHSICGRREENLLAEHVCRVRKQGYKRQHKEDDPGLARREHFEILSIDLRLENLSNWCSVACNDTDIVEQKTGDICESSEPVPIHSLNEELSNNNVHDQSKCDA